jgi:hypothetical protein
MRRFNFFLALLLLVPTLALAQPAQRVQGVGTSSTPAGGALSVNCVSGCSGGGGGGNVTVTAPLGSQTAAASVATTLNGSLPAGTAIVGKVGIDQTTPGTTNGVQTLSGSTTAVTGADPCFASTKSIANFESTTSGGSIITAASAKKAYICSISIITSTAANVSLIEGTGSSVCTGGSTGGVFLNTGVTAANGAAFAANGGIQTGVGMGTVAQNAVANQNICVAFTTTNTPQVNVHVSYVQQ